MNDLLDTLLDELLRQEAMAQPSERLSGYSAGFRRAISLVKQWIKEHPDE